MSRRRTLGVGALHSADIGSVEARVRPPVCYAECVARR